MDKVLLIDFLNIVHRSNIKFGAGDKDKISYTIVYNFFRSLKAMVSTFLPTKVFLCLEGNKNFRKTLFTDYKENRIIKKASKDNINLSRQRDIIIRLLPYLSVTTAHADRFEADDVIGFLSENLKNEDVIIISTDSDFIQLLQRGINVKLYNPLTKEFIKPPVFHYLGWKILRGDKTDNIPGLVSDEKALHLIENPDLLEKFLSSSEENRALFNLNKSLIELATVPDEELIINEGLNNLPLLEEEFIKMEFKSILADKYWSSFKETFSSL